MTADQQNNHDAEPVNGRPPRRMRAVLLAAVALVVVIAGIGFGMSLGGSDPRGGVTVALGDAELPSEEAALADTFRRFLTAPVQLQHRVFTRDRTEPVVTGLGFLDLTSGCRFEVTYTGALYQVEMSSDGRQLLTRNTKRETGAQSPWQLQLPLTANLDSPLFALAGNPSLLYCNLTSLSRSVRNESDGYRIDAPSLAALLASQRQQELNALFVLASVPEADRVEMLRDARVDVTPLTTLLERLTVEDDGRGTMRITVIGDGGRVVDELLLRHTSAPAFTYPVSEDAGVDLADQARRILGVDQR